METSNANRVNADEDTQTAKPPQYFKISIEEANADFACSENESVLIGMNRLGKKGIPVGCRSGGCSVCKVQVTKGEFQQHRPMSMEYISKEELEASCVLACCIKPLSDLEIKVLGKMHKNIISKKS